VKSNELGKLLEELRLDPDNPHLRRAFSTQVFDIVWPHLARHTRNVRYLAPDCDCEDLVNETLYRVLKWSLRRAISSPEAHLEAKDLISIAIVTCRNVTSDIFRRRALRSRHLESRETGESTSDSSSPLIEVVLGDRAELLKKVLENLDPKERRILQMRFYEGKTYAAIACEMKLSPEGVRYRLQMIVEKLKMWVSKHSL